MNRDFCMSRALQLWYMMEGMMISGLKMSIGWMGLYIYDFDNEGLHKKIIKFFNLTLVGYNL